MSYLKFKYNTECQLLADFLASPKETANFLTQHCLNNKIKATITELNGLHYIQRSEIMRILRDGSVNQGCIANYLEIVNRYAPVSKVLNYKYIAPTPEVVEMAKVQSFKKAPAGTHIWTSQIVTALAMCSSDSFARSLNKHLQITGGFYTYCRSDVGRGFMGYCPHVLMGNILMNKLVFSQLKPVITSSQVSVVA